VKVGEVKAILYVGA